MTNRLDSANTPAFLRRFRFANGRIRSVRWRTRGEESELVVVVAVRRTMQDLGGATPPVRLKFTLKGVEEFRFQKRLNAPHSRISDLRLGFFQGLVFVNFDAWGLQPGEQPAVFDFRASERYVAAREVLWEEVEKKRRPEA
jgi:hypothetical protein